MCLKRLAERAQGPAFEPNEIESGARWHLTLLRLFRLLQPIDLPINVLVMVVAIQKRAAAGTSFASTWENADQ